MCTKKVLVKLEEYLFYVIKEVNIAGACPGKSFSCSGAQFASTVKSSSWMAGHLKPLKTLVL